jgi:hypothetical protein
MLEQRNKELEKSGQKKDKCVNREVCDVFTHGSYLDKENSLGYMNRYTLAYYPRADRIGFCIIE